MSWTLTCSSCHHQRLAKCMTKTNLFATDTRSSTPPLVILETCQTSRATILTSIQSMWVRLVDDRPMVKVTMIAAAPDLKDRESKSSVTRLLSRRLRGPGRSLGSCTPVTTMAAHRTGPRQTVHYISRTGQFCTGQDPALHGETAMPRRGVSCLFHTPRSSSARFPSPGGSSMWLPLTPALSVPFSRLRVDDHRAQYSCTTIQHHYSTGSLARPEASMRLGVETILAIILTSLGPLLGSTPPFPLVRARSCCPAPPLCSFLRERGLTRGLNRTEAFAGLADYSQS